MTKPARGGNAEWYEATACAQGGYVRNWNSVGEGYSGEAAFIERLTSLLRPTL